MNELFSTKIKIALGDQIIEMVDSVLMGDGDKEDLQAICRRYFDPEELGSLERYSNVYEDRYINGFVRGLTETAGETMGNEEREHCLSVLEQKGISCNFIFVPISLIIRVAFMDGLYWGRQVGISSRCRSGDAPSE